MSPVQQHCSATFGPRWKLLSPAASQQLLCATEHRRHSLPALGDDVAITWMPGQRPWDPTHKFKRPSSSLCQCCSQARDPRTTISAVPIHPRRASTRLHLCHAHLPPTRIITPKITFSDLVAIEALKYLTLSSWFSLSHLQISTNSTDLAIKEQEVEVVGRKEGRMQQS